MVRIPIVVQTMSTNPVFENRMQSLQFNPLNANGSNFLEWVNDAKTVLCVGDLAKTLTVQPSTSIDPAQQILVAARWQALHQLRRHLDHSLRLQYLQIEDPAELWALLHSRFNQQQTLFLPQARYDWINLCVMDFSDFASFNSELHRVTAQLCLCGETLSDAELIEKTLSTFPPATAILFQQYRNMKFKKHANLMSHLWLAEKHHQLLLRNADSKPTREIHNIAAVPAYGDSYFGPAGVHAGHTTFRGPAAGNAGRRGPAADNQYRDPAGLADRQPEFHAAQDSRRPPRGSFRRPPPKPQSRPVIRGNQNKPKFPPRSYPAKPIKGNCHKCGRQGHFAKDCRAPPYLVNMYKKLQQLRLQPRQNYNFENPNPSSSTHGLESFMTIYGKHTSEPDVALLDSGSTHTILTSPEFFQFPENMTSWQHCKIITMAGSRNIRFREGRATVILPGGFPLICENAMYAPDAPRSLISYRDLRARKIHVSIAMGNDEEVLELRQGQEILATTHAGDDGLYKIVIKPLTCSPISLIDAEDVSMGAWAGNPEASRHNLTQGVSLDTIAKPDLWHKRLGHPCTTLFRWMLPLLIGHNLLTSVAEKTHDCVACIQGKYIKKTSTWTLPKELPPPLYKLHGDICGLINPPSGYLGIILFL